MVVIENEGESHLSCVSRRWPHVAVTEQLVTGFCQIRSDLAAVSDPPKAKYYLTKSHPHAAKRNKTEEMLNALPNQAASWNMGERLSTCVLAHNYALFVWIG